MAIPQEPVLEPKKAPSNVRVHLSTAENVGRIFDLDWCIIVGAKAGDVRFIPWTRSPGDEAEARRWLGHLAELLPKSPESSL